MIDLERELAPLVDTAPEAPPVSGVRTRVRRRRSRRNIVGGGIGVAAAVVAVAAVVSTMGTRHHSAPVISTPGPSSTRAPSGAAAGASITVTAPDGSRYTVTGRDALGLSTLPVRFNAQISSVSNPPEFPAQPVTVQDASAALPHTCASGDVYGRWRVVLGCASNATMQRILTLLHPRVGSDGYLVFTPESSLVLGPTDAPDVELGDDAIGIFGPSTYPAGCPTTTDASGRTAQGDLAQVNDTGAWWCEATAHVRIHVSDAALIGDALHSLRVVAPPIEVTSLYGDTFRIDAPGVALGHPRFDAGVDSDASPFAGAPTVVVTQEPRPSPQLPSATYTTADGHDLAAAKSGLGQDELVGAWDGWTVSVTADGLSDPERARLASLLRFREEGGFLVLDPVSPLHVVGAAGSEIVFDGVDIGSRPYPGSCPTESASTQHTAAGFPVQVVGDDAIWCDTAGRVWIRANGLARDAAIKGLRVTRVG
jgi:hypothetical protein